MRDTGVALGGIPARNVFRGWNTGYRNRAILRALRPSVYLILANVEIHTEASGARTFPLDHLVIVSSSAGRKQSLGTRKIINRGSAYGATGDTDDMDGEEGLEPGAGRRDVLPHVAFVSNCGSSKYFKFGTCSLYCRGDGPGTQGARSPVRRLYVGGLESALPWKAGSEGPETQGGF